MATLRIEKQLKFFWIIRILYAFFSIFIFSKLTVWGDTERYISAPIGFVENTFTNSTSLMDFLGSATTLLFGKTFGHFFFCFISTWSLQYVVKKIGFQSDVFFMFFLLSLPSFNSWTTIASKESMSTFGMSMVLCYIIDVQRQSRITPKIAEILGFYIVFVFKPQYLISIFHIIALIYICKYFKSSIYVISSVLIVILFDIYILNYFSIELNIITFSLHEHFDPLAGSTRENYWTEYNDVFYKAPYGMFISFFGPTFSESLQKWSYMMAFIESFIICMLLIFIIFKIYRKRHCKVYHYIMSFALFWLLAVHYLQGTLNPGSALRYRENFYSFLIIFLYWIREEIILFQKQSLVCPH